MLSKKLISFLKKNKKNILKSKIICIGDVILDNYIDGKVERVSPEAPVPILMMKNQKYVIGGAGNVAKNISDMGACTSFIHLSGNDSASMMIKKLLKENKNIKDISINVPNFKTPTKTRFIKNNIHLLRVDNEDVNFKLINKYKTIIIKKLKNKIKQCDLVVLSDYNKGLLDEDLIKKIIKLCIQYNKIVIADPKKIDLNCYNGINILTPNQKEITDTAKKNFLNDENLFKFAKKIVLKNNIKNLLITRSEKGMLLVNGNIIKKYRANAKKIVDVTGAGDTVIATLATMLTLGMSIDDSIKVSNYAAGLSISKKGTASINYADFI